MHSHIQYVIAGPMRTLADVALAMVRAALDPAVFDEAFVAGRQMRLEEAFASIRNGLLHILHYSPQAHDVQAR